MERSSALGLTERISAVTHLVSSLEYLAKNNDRRRGGVNNWNVTRRRMPDPASPITRLLDVVADPRVTNALHVLRVGAALALMAPTSRKVRLAANGYLAASAAVLYPRHHYGTDGSDQVSFLVQSATTVARAGERNPKVVDAALWFVGLQSTLSYAVSGWVKMVSPTWRSGRALPGIVRTRTYGDRQAWELTRRYPKLARALCSGVLAMECAFPAAYLARGRLAPTLVGAAAAFHLANARVLGLNRFTWSFISMHPAVLYTSAFQDLERIDQC